VRVAAAVLSYPPHRFIGSELMTHSLLKRLAGRGHDVRVTTTNLAGSWLWDGLSVSDDDPSGDVLVYHAEAFGEPAASWGGPKVAICHNDRMGVELGLYNLEPEVVTVNSSTMGARFGGVVVHPPVPPVDVVHGSRVTVINLEATSKVGPFWEVAALMPDVEFLGVTGGYGDQAIPSRIPSNVKVIGQVAPDRMVSSVWSDTSVLLVPSASESWSMVSSEAMSHGIPVIAHPLPGLQENLADAGVWADRGNPNEWVDQIRSVLSAREHYSSLAVKRAAAQAALHELEAEAWCDVVEGLCL